MQLQRKLFLFLSALTIPPLLLLQFGVVDRNERLMEDRVRKSVQASLDKLAGELSTLLNAQKSLVRGLAAVPAVQDFAQAVTEPGESKVYRESVSRLQAFFLNYQAAVPAIQALRVMDNAGNTLVKVKEHKVVKGLERLADGRSYVANHAYKPFFKALAGRLGPGGVGLSDFELGQVSPRANFCPSMIRYMTPLPGAEPPPGYLVVNIWGTRIDDVIASALSEYGPQALMVELAPSNPERQGIYLYHPEIDRRFGNQTGSGARMVDDIGIDAWNSIVNGPGEGDIQLGNRMLFYRKFLPFEDRDTLWLLSVSRDRSEFLQPVLDMRVTIWALLGLVILMTLLLTRWSAARLARPVQELADILTRYAHGERIRYRDRRQDEIGQVGQAYNYLCDSLERAERERERAHAMACQAAKIATVGELAAGVAHEINNPLNNMMGLAELLESSDLPSEVRQDLAIMRKEGRRCASIVQNLLDFARPRPPSMGMVDLVQVVHDCQRLVAKRVRDKSLRLSVTPEGCSYMVYADAGQLQQVVVNFLLNAIHASPEGGAVRVLLNREGAAVECRVEDEGCGVAEDDLGRIFEPFYTTKQDERGTGLGLAVSYAIVQHHGGHMGVHNRREGGLSIWFRVPAEAAPGPESVADGQVVRLQEREMADAL